MIQGKTSHTHFAPSNGTMRTHEENTGRPLLNPAFNSSFNEQDSTSGKENHSTYTRPISPMQEHVQHPNNPSIFDRIRSLYFRGWTAEVISCLFATASLMGLVITLLAHQNRPLPQWPQIVTINSIVSIFSLLIRAGVGFVLAEGISQTKWQWYRKPRELADMQRFDAASRGGWGSLVLLSQFRLGRPYWIAALGAFITVMATLTGFFTQQLVVFEECLQKDSAAIVGVYRAQSYNATGSASSGSIFDIYAPMAAAINIGIIESITDQTSQLSHNCITGNCTFAADNGASFSSIGMDYSCKNVTSDLKITINGTTGNGNVTLALGSPGSKNLTMSILDNVVLVTGTMAGGYEQIDALTTIKMIYRKDPGQNGTTAYSCAIFPTINTYGANITKGRLEESLIDSVPMRTNKLLPVINHGLEYLVQYKRGASQVIRDGTRQSCDRKESPGNGLVEVAEYNLDPAPYPEGDAKANSSRLWYVSQECVSTFGRGAAYGIDAYLRKIFDDESLRYDFKNSGNQGSVYLREMYHRRQMTLATLDDMFKNLTTAMTTVIRRNGIGNQQARGDMWYTTTCMKIDWPWISVPVVMIVLAAIFLVLVSIESRGVESDRLWKSSVLAGLFCEVDRSVVGHEKTVGKRAMGEIASSTSVCIETESGALRLVGR